MKHERDRPDSNADRCGIIVSAIPQSISRKESVGDSGKYDAQLAHQKILDGTECLIKNKEQTVPHILCVDDEPDILEMAALSLEMVGNYEVTCASSGSHALQLASKISPDLILLDVMMPVMAGPATLQALQSDELTAAIPIVFMTARVQPEEVEEYIQLGASGVIHKPFDPMLLATQLGNIMDLAREQ